MSRSNSMPAKAAASSAQTQLRLIAFGPIGHLEFNVYGDVFRTASLPVVWRSLRCSSSLCASTDRSFKRFFSAPYQTGAPRLRSSAVVSIPPSLLKSPPDIDDQVFLHAAPVGREMTPASDRNV